MTQFVGFIYGKEKGFTTKKAVLREMNGSCMKENGVKVKDGIDVNSIMCDRISVILDSALDAELDEDLGYSKYIAIRKQITAETVIPRRLCIPVMGIWKKRLSPCILKA